MSIHVDAIPVGPFEVNCYLCWHEASAEAAVIDPGSDARLIRTRLEQHRLVPAAYLLTHGHADHVHALSDLARIYPAPTYIRTEDLAWAFLPRNSIPPYYPAPLRPAGDLRTLEQSTLTVTPELVFSILPTPGHTPGGVCFHLAEAHILFTGDTLFQGSVGRTDLPGGDSRVLAASLRQLTGLSPETIIYPGHGPSSTLAEELDHNFFLQRLPGSRG